MASETHRIDTRLIHAGEPEKRICGAVSLPIFQSSTFEYAGQSSYDELKYIRMNNTPNHEVLHRKLAILENAEAALVTASGMAAISTTLLALFSPGDHILVQDCLYGGTQDFIVSDFAPLGFQFDFIDADDPESWASMLKPNTRGLYVETITNPLIQVGDLNALAEFARANGLISMIDNTFATPVNFRPAEWGYDISLHSCTKYLNGHSDIVAGAVIGTDTLVEKDRPQADSLGREPGSPRLFSPASGDENPGPARSPPEPQRPEHCRNPRRPSCRRSGQLPRPARPPRPWSGQRTAGGIRRDGQF